MRRHRSGYTLTEILLFFITMALCLSFAVPMGSDGLQRRRLMSAARHMATMCRRARLSAVLEGRSHGIWFRRTEMGYRFALYADGNGNGMHRAEILNGTDPQVIPEQRLGERFSGVSFRILDRDDIPNIPPEGGRLDPSDPLRIGRSDLLSFSPLGKSSGGTLYLSSSTTRMAAVRIYGPTCRTRIWEYDLRQKKWKMGN